MEATRAIREREDKLLAEHQVEQLRCVLVRRASEAERKKIMKIKARTS